LRFVLKEGRNRQIRRMAEAVGLKVTRLHRTNFAGISLAGLTASGDWKLLNGKELKIVHNAIIKSWAYDMDEVKLR
jgi:16S rRNA U516 pseudouridylate synthase RsuA-like enzyme